MTVKYDRIGLNYNETRKADPYLTERLLHHLQPKPHRHYLDIGCGTGNYTVALYQQGLNITGVEPSETMLLEARAKTSTINWKQGRAEDIPTEDQSIDGITATFTLHHWTDLPKALKELKRVLKPHGRVVILTSTPKQMAGYWLNHYFPQMLEDSMVQMPSYEKVAEALTGAGFTHLQTEAYHVREDLQDHFLYVGKHDPTLYLNEAVRHGISSFSDLANREEVAHGLARLEADLVSGEITKVQAQYANDLGDYLFVVAEA